MKVSKPLPAPSSDAIAHSQRLVQQIREEIEQEGGTISFRRYMEMALYEPGLGYYVAGKRQLGATGDFVTAPEISSLFSRCLANQCAQIMQSLQPAADILEFGAGSGVMACDLLLHLEQLDCLPEHYFILDISPQLKARQRLNLEKHAPHLLPRVQWLTHLPQPPFNGIILANEVLDAMPVERFTFSYDSTQNHYQHRVGWENKQLQLVLAPATTHQQRYIQTLGWDYSEAPHADYHSEYNPNLPAWIAQLGQVLQQGVILLIDYGYTRKEYYHSQRADGTLICHYQHLVHNDFFWHPGLQDITANVDFTHVAQAASKKNLTISGFTTQAAFLIASGLEALFMDALSKSPEQQHALAQQIRTLTLPAEMGEHFKVMALSKSMNEDLIGFSVADYRSQL